MDLGPISSVPSTNNTIIIIIIIIVPRSLLRNAPHPSGVRRAVKAAPTRKHSSPQQNKKKEERWVVSLGIFSFRLFVSQAHSNRSIALLLIVKGAGGGSGMLHHTKVNDCVTEAGCNKQSGMTHFPEGWTRLGRRRRWLASPSGLARERAREKKKKGGTVHPRISCGRPLSQWWREGYTGAKRKKIPGWSRPAGSGWLGLGAYRYMSDWATHTLVCIRRSLAP